MCRLFGIFAEYESDLGRWRCFFCLNVGSRTEYLAYSWWYVYFSSKKYPKKRTKHFNFLLKFAITRTG